MNDRWVWKEEDLEEVEQEVSKKDAFDDNDDAFNQNQPRASAGGPDGGQWISTGGAKSVDIDKVKTSQAKSETNKYRVEHYQEALSGKAGKKSKVIPLEVVHNKEDDDYRLLDGHHRLYAARKLGLKQVKVRVAFTAKNAKEANQYIRAMRFGDDDQNDDGEIEERHWWEKK